MYVGTDPKKSLCIEGLQLPLHADVCTVCHSTSFQCRHTNYWPSKCWQNYWKFLLHLIPPGRPPAGVRWPHRDWGIANINVNKSEVSFLCLHTIRKSTFWWSLFWISKKNVVPQLLVQQTRESFVPRSEILSMGSYPVSYMVTKFLTTVLGYSTSLYDIKLIFGDHIS
jgi:hypothetical protein